jgi:hypothetical protein
MENQQNPQNQQSLQEQENQQSQNDILFVVSSAIYANWGVYNTQERLAQTIGTCRSIRDHVPNCDIILLDGGTKNLEQEEQNQIKDHINTFYSFAEAENVKQIQSVQNWDIVKNMIEIMIFGSYYSGAKDTLISKYKRIFKMSGRYVLNDDFDLEKHMAVKDKIVVRGPYTSQFNAQITGGVTLQYMSRLWSFDASLIDYIAEVYKQMFDHMQNRLQEGGYIDIEHMMFYHLRSDLIEFIPKIGVEGNIAPNGVGIKE